jgi:hypothetical protein
LLHPGSCRSRVWRPAAPDIDGELAQEFAVAVEYLNPVIAAIGDIDIAVGVGRDRMRGVELAGLLAALAP